MSRKIGCCFLWIYLYDGNLIAMNKSFGEQVRAERKKQGLRVELVAEACGVSRSHITLIENGKRLPGKKVLPKIALVLHLETTIVLNWYLEDVSQKMRKGLEISEE